MTTPLVLGALVRLLVRQALGLGDPQVTTGGLVHEPDPDVRIVERGREEEKIGDDPPLRYDNRTSMLEQHYTIAASREWRREVKVDRETLESGRTTFGAGVQLPQGLGVKVETAISRSLKEAYSTTEGRSEKFEHTIDLTVAPRTLALVTLQWKRIWQVGDIRVVTAQGSTDIPFRSLAGVAFDVHTETRSAVG